MQVFSGREENFRHLPCYMPWHHITVIANGNIAPCFNGYVWETKVSLKDNALAELWYGPYFEGFRKQLEARKLWDTCATCCVWRVFENREIRDEMRTRGPQERKTEERSGKDVDPQHRVSAIMRSLVDRAKEVVPLAGIRR